MDNSIGKFKGYLNELFRLFELAPRRRRWVVIALVIFLQLVYVFGLFALQNVLVPLSGKSLDEIFDIWDSHNIRSWERVSLQIMLYGNLVRPFAYFFQIKSQAASFTAFAKEFGQLADVSEGVFLFYDELELFLGYRP